jgi:acetoacetyl-CoA synthetase
VQPIWTPDPATVPRSPIFAFTQQVADRYGVPSGSYLDLWRWSVERPEQFWEAVWEFFDIRSETPPDAVLADASMPGARWFTGTRLNYAEHALRHAGEAGAVDEPAVLAVGEDGSQSVLSWGALGAQVASFAAWLKAQGVASGDRVVGYLPNGPHAVVAFLAAASLGAVWSACGQDYGAQGAAGRFGQLDPVVLVAADGYHWNGRRHDRRDEVERLRAALPSLRVTVCVPHLGLEAPSGDGLVAWADAIAERAEPAFEPVGFDAPLWVLFSSGTTGAPKGIVHGHGGVLVDHVKLLGLHLDVRPGDRFFWYTNTNWMMWNMVVSGLLTGSTIVVYDGSPAYPGPQRLWEIAAEHRVAVLGVSPGYLLGCAKAALEPGRDLDLGALRVLGSTGAPLPADSYPWVRDHVSPSVQVDSTSGGTDVVSGFAGSAPTTPVWPGEISAPLLGVALEAWDSEGHPVVGQVGELVVTKPMPSMPVFFWNDPDGSRYHDAYFSTYPGVWRHGDWITITSRGSVVITGRSDSTLNRQGVRLGSADIYDVVEPLPEIREALVIGAELPDGGYWMPLFVVLEDGVELDSGLRERIVTAISTQASPRHVPDDIIVVPALPHTRTGKKLEVPVKRLLQGAKLQDVANRDAVDDVEVLASFSDFAKIR